MTAQLANGGFRIYPKITVDKKDQTFESIKYKMEQNTKTLKENISSDSGFSAIRKAGEDLFNVDIKEYVPLFRNQENVKFVLDAMFASTNEIRGTSYSSRINDDKYRFAGKTGTSQVKRITKKARELDLTTSEIAYQDRDHALFIAFGPYKSPRYAVSIIVEHGGSGSSTAAPMAKKLFKLIVDRHELRTQTRNKNLEIS